MKLFLAMIAAIAMAGCSTTGVEVRQEQLAQFQKGVSTEADVVAALGKPNAVRTSSDGSKSLVYAYARSQVRGATFIPVVGLFAGGADVHGTSTVFEFDAAGKLVSHETTESQYGSSLGQ